MDYLILSIIVFLVVLATVYIVKAKMRGDRCIGCPYSGTCNKNSCDNNKG